MSERERRDATGKTDATKTSVPPTRSAPSVETLREEDDHSMSVAFFVYFVIPCVVFALFSRYTVDTSTGSIEIPESQRSIPFLLDDKYLEETEEMLGPADPIQGQHNPALQPFTPPSSWPTSYAESIDRIERRRKRWKDTPKKASQQQSSAPPSSMPKPSQGSIERDPQRKQVLDKIDELRGVYRRNPNNVLAGVQFADVMRYYDVTYHDGGRFEKESIETYKTLIRIVEVLRQEAYDAGEPTDVAATGKAEVSEEVTLEFPQKSLDGTLCALYAALGKVYFMANMFEKAVEEHTNCLELEPYYLDALNSRGSNYLVLGDYNGAGQDFMNVIMLDQRRLFTDAFSGLARVLEAKEDAIPGGWDTVVSILINLIPRFEETIEARPEAKQPLSAALNRFHHVLFTYNDRKTKNYDEAWKHLTKSYKYKMSLLPPWREGYEKMKVDQARMIFHENFWTEDSGSDTETPIFIIGFVRSGSTLLERVLDAHPQIVGTGENSVFNGRLPEIRDAIVKASQSGNDRELSTLTRVLADSVVDDMRQRWVTLEANTMRSGGEKSEPLRFCDKMLTNYMNVGFIQLLYPKALILHVYRNPMDTLWSAFKHEFPSGNLDYTCDIKGLAEMYRAYRDVIEHWDRVLPDRITHIRHEDMVEDMPGMARAIIAATGLDWDDSVLDFHKKKHAVNTLSSTQVRKGVNKDSVEAWRRYENQLQPLADLLREMLNYEIPHRLQPIHVEGEARDEL